MNSIDLSRFTNKLLNPMKTRRAYEKMPGKSAVDLKYNYLHYIYTVGFFFSKESLKKSSRSSNCTIEGYELVKATSEVLN